MFGQQNTKKIELMAREYNLVKELESNAGNKNLFENANSSHLMSLSTN